MFVLCPHCHFLVGMDPRSGGPPAACPKCGGTVVEPVAASRSEAPALDPFAESVLPSVAPTLQPAEPLEAEADAVPEAASVQTTGTSARSEEPADAMSASATEAAMASAPAMGDAGTADATEPTAATSGEGADAADASAHRPSADEMIAALATRPARKPRAPKTRTRKPPAPPAVPPEAEAETPPPVVATELPESAPSAAAGLGARLRRLFARAPRPAAGTQVASPDATAVPAPVPTPDPADATPATPALSIRNRRKRSASKSVESPPEIAGPPAAPGDDATEIAVPAAAETGAVAANAPEAMPDALPPAIAPAVDGDAMPAADVAVATAAPPSPRQESREPDRGEAGSDMASADGPADAPLAPPENIDAAAATLVAAMPATATQAPASPSPARPAPSFATTHATTTRSRRDYRAIGAALALTFLLGLQLLLAQRAVLSADPGWRPTIAALCSVLRCTLPPWREPAAFTMLSRHVRPHPDAPGTLLIDASFRNDARWPQPWPRLALTLSDVDGRTVGARTFEVGEYLGAAPAQAELAPGQSASLSLAVVEPAPDIVSFTFDFR